MIPTKNQKPMKGAQKSLKELPKGINGGLGRSMPGPPPFSPNPMIETHLEFSCEGNDYPLIPAKNYAFSFVKAEKRKQWKGHKLFLWFKVETPGEFHGTQLFLACNLKTEGKISTRSKYYRNWVIAAGRKPDRYEKKRMTTRVFEGKIFEGKVPTVKKDQMNLPLPPDLQYSKIEGLVTRLTD